MPNGAGQDPVPRSRVRDLARRFEEISTAPFPTPAKPAKRIGKFRIQAPSEPVKVGLARKRSSLKKKSLSSYEIFQGSGF
ncbi:unnamed protein product, partial [Mesorhabditis spiculigera]